MICFPWWHDWALYAENKDRLERDLEEIVRCRVADRYEGLFICRKCGKRKRDWVSPKKEPRTPPTWDNYGTDELPDGFTAAEIDRS